MAADNDIDTTIRNLARAILEGDKEAADNFYTEAMLHFIEKGVRGKAEQLGYIWQPGTTFTNLDGETSALLPLNPDAAEAREQYDQAARDELVENFLAARLAVGASRIPRIARYPGERRVMPSGDILQISKRLLPRPQNPTMPSPLRNPLPTKSQ